MNRSSFIYIITNKTNSVLYIGVTSCLAKRIYEHKNTLVKSFSKKYRLNKLIYYEIFENIQLAIKREKQLRNWHRDWKFNLIKNFNPEFKDLYSEILK